MVGSKCVIIWYNMDLKIDISKKKIDMFCRSEWVQIIYKYQNQNESVYLYRMFTKEWENWKKLICGNGGTKLVRTMWSLAPKNAYWKK